MDVLDALNEAKAAAWSSEDGDPLNVSFAPGLSEDRLREIETAVGVRLPADYRSLATSCGGIDGTLEQLDFGGIEGQSLDEVMPHALHFAADGYGNSWFVDCRLEPEEEAKVFYASHDAPVVLFQCQGMATFLRELVRFHQPPYRSLIDDVHEDRIMNVWSKRPAAISQSEALSSPDPAMRSFAAELEESFMLVDLRDVCPGMGFAWGSNGPQTRLRRFGDERIFAYAPAVRKQGILSRLFRSA